MNQTVHRLVEGWYRPIPPTEYLAWSTLSGNVVNHVEYDILVSMDKAFCDESNKELNANRCREEERRKREIEEARKPQRRR